jgi:DNA polymerase-3 subunit delta'
MMQVYKKHGKLSAALFAFYIFTIMQFKQLAGQNEIKNRLIQSVLRNRISHAQLFLGASGSGSLALAIAYAQFIACSDRTESDSCGACASCVKFQKIAHPDSHMSLPVNWDKPTDNLQTGPFLELFRAQFQSSPYLGYNDWVETMDLGNKQPFISNHEVYEIIRTLSFKSYESDYKFLIMWLPEKMRTEGANRLLKTLEEPFDKTLIILVSEDASALLPTIVSRTQMIRIPAIEPAIAAEWMVNNSAFSHEKCLQAARMTAGNISEMNSILAHSEEAEAQLEQFRNWMLGCYKFDITPMLHASDSLAKESREAQKAFLHYALYMIREALLMNNQPELNRMADWEGKFMEKFCRFFQPESYPVIAGYINDAIVHLERNANARILLFDLSLWIADFFRKEKIRMNDVVKQG